MNDKESNIKSARKLAVSASKVLLNKHMDLLKKFDPYIKSKKDNTDWVRNGSFYNWCSAEYRKHSS